MRSQLVLLALGALSGCLRGPSGPSAPAENRAEAPAWQLRVAHSGGFAGLVQEFELDSATATIVAHDRRSGATVSRPLTTAELAELDKLLAAAATAPESDDSAAPRSSRCADCAQTELQGIYGDRRIAASRTDGAAVGAHDEVLARTLELGQPLLQRTQ